MASNIDPTKPERGNATTQSVRSNFQQAKNEIEALQGGTSIQNVTLPDGGAVRTDQNDGDTALLQAYDVNAGAYKDFGTLQAGSQPSFTLTSPTLATRVTFQQATANYTLQWADPSAARNLTIPDPGSDDSFVFEDAPQTLTDKTLTSPDINGGTADALTSLGIRSTGTGSFDLQFQNTENLTANRALTIATGDAARTLTLQGDPTLDDWFDQSVKQAASPTFASVTIGASVPFSDASGTLTLQNVDALDPTTEDTIEGAIDSLPNLTVIQGRTVSLSDAGADAVFGWDDSAGQYENLTAAEVRAAAGLSSSDSPEFSTVELGHASDTTLARASAGDMNIEGNIVYRAGGTDVPLTDGGTGASDAATARTNLDVPGLSEENTFTENQIVQRDGSTCVLDQESFSDTVNHNFFRGAASRGTVASPAALNNSDGIWQIAVRGHDGSNMGTSVGIIDVKATENFTATNQGLEFAFRTRANGNAGTGSIRWRMAEDGGLTSEGATGGSQGTDTLNASEVHDDGTLLTDIVQDAIDTGSVDTDKWDAMVPDKVIPEDRQTVPVEESVEETVTEDVEDKDGNLIRRVRRRTVQRPVYDRRPVFDESGQQIDTVKRQRMQEVVTPARTEPRKHHGAHLLKAMMDQGLKPWDYASVRDWWRNNRTVPGLPGMNEWNERGGKIGLGEMDTRNRIATEILCECLFRLADRIDDHEARLSELEGASVR